MMLKTLGFEAISIHGQMPQSKRISALNRFKAGEKNVLLGTDVASRGLDIPIVDVVMNYDVPPNAKDYVHRVGRTARAGRSGRAVTMVTQYDVENFQKIEHAIRIKMEEFPMDREEVLLLLERVTEALRLSVAEIKEAEEKQKRRMEHENADEPEFMLKTVLRKKKKRRS